MNDREIKWAIVGLGDIVRKRVGPALLSQPQSRLRACVTRDASRRADDLASLCPERVYADFDEMLNDTAVDAVYVSTPVYLHAPQAIAALKAQKHVIVEKPMSLSVREAKDMVKAAEDANRNFAVAYYRRFWPSFQRVYELIRSGKLGEIVHVRVVLHSWYMPVEHGEKSWRVRPEESGGGVLFDVGSHRLDLLAWWFGLPRRVIADVRTQTHDYEGEDSATALLMLENEVPCTVSFHWNSKTWADELHIVGTDGNIAFRVLDGDELTITLGRESKIETHPRPSNAHLPMIDDFACSVIEGRSPAFNGIDGMSATQIMEWMVQSSAATAWIGSGK
jgi:predicted dehydrogenase